MVMDNLEPNLTAANNIHIRLQQDLRFTFINLVAIFVDNLKRLVNDQVQERMQK